MLKWEFHPLIKVSLSILILIEIFPGGKKWWFYASVIILNRDPSVGRGHGSYVSRDGREETVFWSAWATEGYRKSIYSCPFTIPSVSFFNAGAQMETDAPRPRLNCAAREKSETQELQLFQRGCRRTSPSSSFLPHSLSFTLPFFPQPSLCLPLLCLSPELWYGNLSPATAQG